VTNITSGRPLGSSVLLYSLWATFESVTGILLGMEAYISLHQHQFLGFQTLCSSAKPSLLNKVKAIIIKM